MKGTLYAAQLSVCQVLVGKSQRLVPDKRVRARLATLMMTEEFDKRREILNVV
jgi:hypothetical protein